MSFWLGMMNIAQRSGLIESISKAFRPIVRILFPDIPKGHPAENWILMNFIANMFGVGNGATAFGLKAMKELDTLNHNKKKSYQLYGHVPNNKYVLIAIGTSNYY